MFDPTGVKESIEAIEKRSAEPGFWDDTEKSKEAMREKSLLEARLKAFNSIADTIEEIEVLLSLAIEEDDEASADEARESLANVEELIEAESIKRILGEETDTHNAIVTIHPGAGGTEAQDWAGILLRMYRRFAERRGFVAETLDFIDGEEAGIKSVTFSVTGDYAYGYLKAESGVHRLVRISPYDAAKRRHTSFASV
ncbi:MAG: PCRF domain-containing protein, partial [Deltaproteobacteria bacterium]|nr:PCRF domain-containing protein [Deltaproteobacteria bacterium]